MKSIKDFGFWIRLSGSILLLFYVFQKVGWQEVWNQITKADPFFFALYLFLSLLAIIVSSIKWLLLSKSDGITPSFSRLLLLYLVGMFFNNVLPTSVGGDVVRAYELGKFTGRKPEAMASVFMERFTGLTTLMLFSFVAVGLEKRFLGDIRITICLTAAVLTYVLILFIVVNRTVLLFFQQINPIKFVDKLLKKAVQIQDAIHMYQHQKQTLVFAMVYSVMFYVICILNIYVGCLTFDVHVSLKSLCVAVPLMLLVFTIPISIGGIGLHEWGYFFVLAMVGVPHAVGLSLGLMNRAKTIGFGLIGGAIYPFVSSRNCCRFLLIFDKKRTLSDNDSLLMKVKSYDSKN